MAWNEPGGNDKDPWGNKNQGPPDLDEAFKELNKKINKFFGGKGGGDQGASGPGYAGLVAILVVASVIWVAMGFFTVDESERAVIYRFGQHEEDLGPGLQWRPAIVYTREIVQVTNVQEYSPTDTLMLTEDENIIEMPLVVQWRITNVADYVLNVKDADRSLEHATDSALRHVIGSTTLESALSDGRAKIAVDIQQRLQGYLDDYKTGILVVKVNLNRAEPPEAVREAFDDVISAKEDREKSKNKAQAYANERIPLARGIAQQTIEEAKAYKEGVVSNAQGDADRFLKLYAEYKKAPEIMRQRLYIDTMEQVMGKSTKVLVDVEGGNNMLYLPIDKLANSAPVEGQFSLSKSDLDYIARKIANDMPTPAQAPRRVGSR